jgi:hypothetical protein
MSLFQADFMLSKQIDFEGKINKYGIKKKGEKKSS